ncbi:MAG TPA: DUF1080 domain-containing protein [Candidatus Didemnitutus sp.]|nr:DUF1080 domain-containing protein [Candidatus Didemnitutus sp.]
MWRLLPLLFLAASRLSAATTDLFADLSTWEYVTPDKNAKFADVCVAKPDGVLAVAGKPVGYLVTKSSHANYRLHVEWRWSDKPGNGGVLVHISSGPVDRNTWPVCFQIQTKNKNVGDLLPMADAKFAEPLSTPPDAKTPILNHSAPDSEKPVGEWNTADIVCRGETIQVTINGVAQNKVTGCSVHEGAIGLQLEGTPFELRNVSLAPLD